MAAAYGVNTLRLALFFADPVIGTAAGILLGGSCSALSSVLLIAGGLRMGGAARWPRWLVPVALAGVACAAWAAFVGMPVRLRAAVFFGLSGASMWVFAWSLVGRAVHSTFGGFRVAAVFAALLGALRFGAAWWGTAEGAQAAGLILASTLYLSIGVALIVALQRSQFLEAREAKDRAERLGRHFQAAIDSTTDMMGLLRVAADGRLIVEQVNAAFLAFARTVQPGPGIAGVVGRDMVQPALEAHQLSVSDADRMLAPYREAIRTGLPQHSVARHGERVREALITPLADAQGRVTHVFYRGTDVTDLRRAKKDRRRASQASERLAAVFNVSPTPLLVAARDDGRLLEVNDTWLRLHGRQREEVIGRTSAELELGVCPADADRIEEALRRDGRARNILARIRRGTGEVVDVSISAEPIEWGGVPARLVTSHDVTELERARSEAQSEHDRLQAILEHSPVAISISRYEDGTILYANPAWCRQTGYTLEEAIGASTVGLGIWSDAGARDETMLRHLSAGEPASFAHSHRNKRGEQLHLLTSSLAIEYRGGRCVLAISQNVTAAEENWRRVGEATERLAKVFSLSPAALAVTRLEDGTFLEVNDAWLAFYRAKREQVIGRTSLQMGHWVDPDDRRRLRELLQARGRVGDFFTRFRLRDGTLLDCVFRAEIIDWDGTRAILASVQDISGLQRLNETLERRVHERTAELEQTLGELEAFAYSVSHDLRAPLRAMSSFASLLAARPAVAGDAQAAAHAARITRAAGRMAQIVNDLLDYSRLARQPIRMQDFDLGAEVRALARDLGEQAPCRRVRWDIGPLPVVRADATLLRLTVQNLLDNALKYTRPREEALIEVRARETEEALEVSVRDNGVGFDPAHAANLFRPFQRLHEESEFEGTGIGLAHAKRIVERHGGRIWAEAEPGKGATFRFTLAR